MTGREKRVSELKELFFQEVEENTPEEIKNSPIIDLSREGKISFTLTKELVEKYCLWNWLENYKKEAFHSSTGIRGSQNISYFWDHRFMLHELGVVLATLGKAAVLKEKFPGKGLHKICAGEVRYNTDKYIELISRLQAAQGIVTHQPLNGLRTSIWMVSYLIFKNGFDGGEYVTSSHAISKKTATKDLADEGSQFMPEESLKFVEKIEQMLRQAEEKGFTIELSEKNSPLIRRDFDGFEPYAEYLRKGVANETNIGLINDAKKQGLSLIFETCGGCMHDVLPPILERLGIADAFEWHNQEQDPFFHGIGKKSIVDAETGKLRILDLTCDVTIKDVVETMGYEKYLKGRPVGTMVLMTDPDADRLSVGQIEPVERIPKLKELAIAYIPIDDKKVFAFFLPNQSFLCTTDFHAKQLKAQGVWDNHSRIMIKTTVSACTWEEWALNQGVKILNSPVGFNEISLYMRKIEKKMLANPDKEVVLHDAYGKKVNLGVQPRIVFTGEESGGMVIGPEELIEGKGGKKAISMREKSAGEASVIVTALASHLFRKKRFLSEYLEEIFEENKIKRKFDYLHYVVLYDENIPDPVRLAEKKKQGEIVRDQKDNFFASISIAVKERLIKPGQAREILQEAIPSLDFSDLEDVFFVGDGTYIAFSKKFVEIRKSRTDAKIKVYSAGEIKQECIDYARAIGEYGGAITPLHEKYIGEEFLKETPGKISKHYFDYVHKDL